VIHTLLQRRWHVLCTVAVGCLALAAAAGLRLRFDNRPQAWLPERDPARDVYREFGERFGGDTFFLLATEAGALSSPGAREELARLGREIALDPSVRAVQTPFAEGDPMATAREGLPTALQALVRAGEAAEGSARRELLLLEAEVGAGLSFLLLPQRGEEPTQRFRAAQRAALASLPADLARVSDPRATDEVLAALGARGEDPMVRRGLFWWAFARGGELRANPRDTRLSAGLPATDAVMRWVLEREPSMAGAGPHLYFALRYSALGRGLGGDPDRALPHFVAAREGVGGLARVLEARHHAPSLAATPPGAGGPAILAAQRRAYDTFRGLLEDVLRTPIARAPAQRALADRVAHAQARALLADPAQCGVIEPEGAAALSLPVSALPWTTALPGRVLVRGEQAGLLILPQVGLGPSARAKLVERIEARTLDSTLGRLHLAGPEALTHDLDVASQSSFGGLFPVVALLLGAVLLFALRSLKATLAILLTAGGTALATLGLLGLAGRTLNLIVVVLPAVLAVLTTAYALHLVSRYQSEEATGGEGGDARRAAWERAIRATFPPCVLTALTTAAGFGSLSFSEILPVRDMGIFAALGALIACALVFLVLPPLLVGSALGAGRSASGFRVGAYTARVRRAAPLILVVALALGAFAASGLSHLRFESHVLRFFPATHRLPQAFAAVEENLLGLTPLELWLEGDASLLDAQRLGALRELLETARSDPLVQQVISPLSLDPRWDQLSPGALSALLQAGLAEAGRQVATTHLVQREGRVSLRITLACKTPSSEAFDRFVRRLRTSVPPVLGEHLRLTGAVPLLVRVQALLVETQLRSFAVALGVVTLVLLLVYRSLLLVGVSLLPNLLPILLTLGAMGWLDVPLNTATVTVAGIALGLVVDDTIHLLHHYHRLRRLGIGRPAAVCDMLAVVGRPVTVTTAAVALGFGAFAVSSFSPTRYFGALIALTCVFAWVCDVIALPALLLLGAKETMHDPPPPPLESAA
jgi:predicted RND superfamily exporter protein